MAYEMKPNTGSLFKNDKKEADTHPDYKGSALIEGLGECWLDAWVNTANNGSKYMSVKIKPKDANGSRSAPQPASSYDDDSDEIPF